MATPKIRLNRTLRYRRNCNVLERPYIGRRKVHLVSEKRVFMSSVDLVSQQSEFLTDEQRWHAVLQREHAADGRFYYSVSTTGVYCRPSCAARRAQRKNVRFHDNCGDAQKA